MKVDWMTEVVSRDKVIFLLINYEVLLLLAVCILIILFYITQGLSPNFNWSALLMILTGVVIFAYMFLASYIVEVLHVRNELLMIYFQS